MGTEDLKVINGSLSQLKNELQTDKPLKELTDSWEDVELWNVYLRNENNRSGEKPASWYSSAWLFVECYFYRRIHGAIQQRFQLSSLSVEFSNEPVSSCSDASGGLFATFSVCSSVLNSLDPFGVQKQQSFTTSNDPMSSLAKHLLDQCDAIERNDSALKTEFTKFFKVGAWTKIGIKNSSFALLSPKCLSHLQQMSIIDDNRFLCGATSVTCRYPEEQTIPRKVILWLNWLYWKVLCL